MYSFSARLQTHLSNCFLLKSYLFVCILHFLGALKISYRAECWKEGGGPRLHHSKLAALGRDTRVAQGASDQSEAPTVTLLHQHSAHREPSFRVAGASLQPAQPQRQLGHAALIPEAPATQAPPMWGCHTSICAKTRACG